MIYQHEKGGLYRVLGQAKHSETLEPMVVYQDIQGDCQIWTRPKSEWEDGRFTTFDAKPVIDKVALVYIRDKKLLTTRSQGKDFYYFPGGKRDKGESDVECLTRELAEEMGVELRPESIAHYATVIAHAHGNPLGVLAKLTCYTGVIEREPAPGGEIAEIRWLGYADRANVGCSMKIVMDELYHKGMID